MLHRRVHDALLTFQQIARRRLVFKHAAASVVRVLDALSLGRVPASPCDHLTAQDRAVCRRRSKPTACPADRRGLRASGSEGPRLNGRSNRGAGSMEPRGPVGLAGSGQIRTAHAGTRIKATRPLSPLSAHAEAESEARAGRCHDGRDEWAISESRTAAAGMAGFADGAARCPVHEIPVILDRAAHERRVRDRLFATWLEEIVLSHLSARVLDRMAKSTCGAARQYRSGRRQGRLGHARPCPTTRNAALIIF